MVMETENTFDISLQQRRAWLVRQRGRLAGHVSAYLLDGLVDAAAVHEALRRLVERHEMLRTALCRVPGLRFPVQVIGGTGNVAWRELPAGAFRDAEEAVDCLWREEAGVGRDLEAGPAVRVALAPVGPERHVLVVHLASPFGDARTAHELAQAAVRGDGLDEAAQYADYAGWQAELAAAPPGRTLGAAAAAAAALDPRPGLVPVPLDRGTAQRVRDAARALGATVEVFLLACWCALLHRRSGRTAVAVDLVDAGRALDDLRRALGPFELALPLVCPTPVDARLPALLRQVGELVAAARAAPETALRALRHATDRGHLPEPAADGAFRFASPASPSRPGGVRCRLLREADIGSPSPLLLTCTEWDGELVAAIQHDHAYLDDGAARELARQLRELLADAADRLDAAVAELDLVGPSGAGDARDFVVRQVRPLPWEPTTLDDLFAEQARRTPDRAAVVYEDASLTFAALDERSGRLATFLTGRGVGPDRTVAIAMDRSTELIVAVLGILRAGGALLPLDVATARERMAAILAAGRPALVLTETGVAGRLPASHLPTVALDAVRAEIDALPAAARRSQATPRSLAYVMFTSGTSGGPKGVAVEHASVAHLLAALRAGVYARLGADRPLRVAVNGPLAFDTSIKQVVQLLDGHTLHPLPERLRLDPEQLLDYLREHRIDVMDCTPSQLGPLVEAGLLDAGRTELRALLVGGEAVQPALWQRLAAADLACFNLYGPTECTVDTTTSLIGADSATPVIGRPIANTCVAVVDGAGRLVPPGVAGELVVAGPGVARGYLGDHDLTAARFADHPQLPGAGATYRTGDRGRYRPDGQIEFLGRTDRQVKIRGNRVELAEIERVLAEHPAVAEAVVMAIAGAGGDVARLAAYVVPPRGVAAPADELRAHVAGRLPEHMVPATVTLIGSVPLTPNGKVDEARLPAPAEPAAAARDLVPPRNPVEQALAEVWADVLGLPAVGVDDNFFALGGDSIKTIQVIGRARRRGIRILPLQMREHQTVAELAPVVGAQ